MQPKIKVYTTPTCPFCHMVKDYLAANGFEFEEVDVSQDINAAREMVMKSGQMGVPVLDIDGQIIIGFDKEKIDEILKIS